MIEELAARKKLEIAQKVSALEAELDFWYLKSEPKGAFAKHHTQIRAVRAQMQGWNRQVREKLNAYEAEPDAKVFLGKCPNAERLILSQHRIWEYFRSKFIQRNEPSFAQYLAAADEFAWACYSPVQQRIYPEPDNAARKEPPLVFFNGGASPFSLSRDRSFQPELVAGEPINLDPADLVGKLPIPVVGVPWQQISHLPEALVIAHEVGHIVEDDFQLTEGLKNLLDEALDEAHAGDRKSAWQSWLGEIFADLYGCLAAGPAYAGTLIDFLAKAPERIATEEKTVVEWGRYPTDFLRVRIVLKALEILGFQKEKSAYENLWSNFGSKMPAAFETDIERIVPKILAGKHPRLGDSMMAIFAFSEQQQAKARMTAAELHKTAPGKAVKLPTTDIRALFAALRLAFEEKPDAYRTNRYGDIVLCHIKRNVITSAVRSGESKLSGKHLDRKLEAYQKTGAELFNSFFSE